METAAGIPQRAIIFIPHIGHPDGQSIGNVATRLAARLNQNDRDRLVTYEVAETAHTVRFGRTSPKMTASAVTIVRKTQSGQTSLGIYEFSYSTSFIERFAKKSSWKKAFSLLLTVASSLTLLARSFVTGRRPAVAARLKRCVFATAALIVATVVYWFADPEGPVASVAALVIAALVLVACFVAARVARELAVPAPVPEQAIPRPRAAVASALVALGRLPLSAASGWWNNGGRVVLSLGVLGLLLVALELGNPDLGQRLQLAGGFVIVAGMALYAILLVGSALRLAWDAVNGGDGGGTEGATIEEWAAGITVALAAVGITFSPKSLAAGPQVVCVFNRGLDGA